MTGLASEFRSDCVKTEPGHPVTPDALAAAIPADAARVLARDLGGDGPDVTRQDVVSSKGSLGRPQPGVAYALARVPGWRIVVAAAAVWSVTTARVILLSRTQIELRPMDLESLLPEGGLCPWLQLR